MTILAAEKIVREACIAANPSIVELKFGCEIRSLETKMTYMGKGVYWNAFLGNTFVDSGALIIDEILGRPIELADVLLAISQSGKKLVPWVIDENGFFWAKDSVNQCIHVGGLKVQWNLLKPFSLQSDETKIFLAELLQ